MAYGFGDNAIDDHLDHLTAYWAMEETGANNRIDAVGSNDAVPTGNPGTRIGIKNNACDFDGTNHYLTVPDHADVSPVTGLALPMWLYRDSTVNQQAPTNKSTSWYAYCQAGQQNLFFIVYESDGTGRAVGPVTLTIGVLHSVILMACDGFVRIYIDGSEVGTPVAYNNTIQDNANVFRIGSHGGGGAIYRWNGGIDEVPFFKDISFADQSERDDFGSAFWNGGIGRFYHLLPSESVLERTASGLLLRTASGVLERVAI